MAMKSTCQLAITLLVALIVVALPSSVIAETYYVAGSGGVDGNVCTVEFPCATIAHAVALSEVSQDYHADIWLITHTTHVLQNDLKLATVGSLTISSWIEGESAEIDLSQHSIQSLALESGSVPEASLLLKDLKITNGYSGSHGGCLHGDRYASIRMERTLFDNCSSRFEGGAISLSSPAVVKVDLVNVTAQYSGTVGDSTQGGCIHAASVNLTMSGVNLSHCTIVGVNGVGGGLNLMAKSTLDMDNCHVTSCSSSSGGGLFISPNIDVPMTIKDSTFTDNFAGAGGAIYVVTGSLAVRSSTIQGNTANEYWGGGIFFQQLAGDETVLKLLEGTIITNNAAAQGGGGVFLYNSAQHVEHLVTDGTALVRDNAGPSRANVAKTGSLDQGPVLTCSSCVGPNAYCALSTDFAFNNFTEGNPGAWSGCVLCADRFGRQWSDDGLCECLDDHPDCRKCAEGVYWAETRECLKDVFVSKDGNDFNWPCLSPTLPCLNLDSALLTMNTGGVVNPHLHIGPGVWNRAAFESVMIEYPMTIEGAGSNFTTLQLSDPFNPPEWGAQQVWVGADYVVNHPELDVVRIKGISITGGHTESIGNINGGCISVVGMELVALEDVDISHCHAQGLGGCVSLDSRGEVYAENVTLHDCVATSGGCIYSGQNTFGSVVGGKWSECQATNGGGGGGYIYGLHLSGGLTIAHNTASRNGGGIELARTGRMDHTVSVWSNAITSYGSANIFCDAPGLHCLGCLECSRTPTHPHAQCVTAGSPFENVTDSYGCVECDELLGQVWDEEAQWCVCADQHPECNSCVESGVYDVATQHCVNVVYVNSETGFDSHAPCLDAANPCQSLGVALETLVDSSGPMVLDLGAGSYFLPDDLGPEFVFGSGVTIQGAGFEHSFVDLSEKQLVAWSDFTLKGVTIANGSSPGQGGCLAWVGKSTGAGSSQVKMISSVIKNCVSLSRGGAVSMGQHGHFSAYDSIISDSTSLACGGAVFAGNILLDGSSIERNMAENGGGLCAEGPVELRRASTIVDNVAHSSGGGVYFTPLGRFVEGSNGRIHDNYADFYTDIDCASPQDSCQSCWGCSGDTYCSLDPHGVFGPTGCTTCSPELGQTVITDVLGHEDTCACDFDHPLCDSCRGAGGGVYDVRTKSCLSTLLLDESSSGSESSNWPCASAGCSELDEIFKTWSVSPKSSQWAVRIEGHVASSNAVVYEFTRDFFDVVQFYGRGGAGESGLDLGLSSSLRVSPGVELQLESLTLSRGFNQGNGGCVYVEAGGTLTSLNSVLRDCVSENDGGAVAVVGEASFNGVHFLDNSAGGDGGGLYGESGATISFSNGGVIGNRAGFGGGIGLNGKSVMSLGGSTCVMNNSPDGVMCNGFITDVCYISVEWNDEMTIGSNDNSSDVSCLMGHRPDTEESQRSCRSVANATPWCAGSHDGKECASRLGWVEGEGVCRFADLPFVPAGKFGGWWFVGAILGTMGVIGWIRWKQEEDNALFRKFDRESSIDAGQELEQVVKP